MKAIVIAAAGLALLYLVARSRSTSSSGPTSIAAGFNGQGGGVIPNPSRDGILLANSLDRSRFTWRV